MWCIIIINRPIFCSGVTRGFRVGGGTQDFLGVHPKMLTYFLALPQISSGGARVSYGGGGTCPSPVVAPLIFWQKIRPFGQNYAL